MGWRMLLILEAFIGANGLGIGCKSGIIDKEMGFV